MSSGDLGFTEPKSSEVYAQITLPEHVLLRPDAYVGSTAPVVSQQWVAVTDGDSDLDGNGNGDGEGSVRFELRAVEVVPALIKLFDEVLVNALDNKQRDPVGMTRLDVELSADRVSVSNDGAGVPIRPCDDDPATLVPQRVFGRLLTSSNYDDDTRRATVGGRNGYGAKLANMFSSEYVVHTCDGEQVGEFIWRQNMSIEDPPVVRPANKGKGKTKGKGKGKAFDEPGTRVTFRPDAARLGTIGPDALALMARRVYDAAGTTPGLRRVTLNGAVVPVRTFAEYAAMYGCDPCVFERFGDRWHVGIAASKDGAFHQVSFVNGVCTPRGGTHVEYIVAQVVAWLLARLRGNANTSGKNTKENGTLDGGTVRPAHVRHQLWVFVNALVENPAFDSQTKETLTTAPSDFGSSCALTDAFMRRVAKRTDVLGLVTATARAREGAREGKLLRATDGAKRKRVDGVPKLSDANDAGTRKSGECTLILTEGDSAKALAVAGLAVVGRDKYGVFPLRGKLLNPRDAPRQQVVRNEEFNALKAILGLQHGAKYTTASELRYGHVMLMADQDADGSHIKGLVLNFFHYFWPELLRVEGFLQQFVTPLAKARRGGAGAGGGAVLSFFTHGEYAAWLHAGDRAREGWTLKYYKGLGTSTGAEAREYFSNLEAHRMAFHWSSVADDDALDMAFSKRRAEDRRKWIAARDPVAFIDHARPDRALGYSEFVHKELVHFSAVDNVRSIPSVVDGLKPGQRKILHACFLRGDRMLREEIKVAQLAGYVAEKTAYHHGETSLAATIVGMAQTFVGSNNVNLLRPSGQFGTRLCGGKDAASARYIFTRLEPVARALFPKAFDAMLEYVEEDGVRVEPRYFVPVVPLVLLNGAEGIGTGWSTSVPPHNPHDVVAAVRSVIAQYACNRDGTDATQSESGTKRPRTGDRHHESSPSSVHLGVGPGEAPAAAVHDTAAAHAVPAPAQTQTTLVPVPAPAQTQTTLVPWYRGFGYARQNAHTAPDQGGNFSLRGAATVCGPCRVRITELPPGRWTQAYKEWLESPAQSSVVSGVREKHTECTVHFEVTLTVDGAKHILGDEASELLPSDRANNAGAAHEQALLRAFRLESAVSTNNMHLFDADGVLVKYPSTQSIVQAHARVAHAMYVARQKAELEDMDAKLHSLTERARFITEVVRGTVVVANRPRAHIEAELKAKGYTPAAATMQKITAGTHTMPRGACGADDDGPASQDEDVFASTDKTTKGKGVHGYDHLLREPLWALTAERVAQLECACDVMRAKKNALERCTPWELWEADLDALEAALNATDNCEASASASDVAFATVDTTHMRASNTQPRKRKARREQHAV